jgi:hypothetical protein
VPNISRKGAKTQSKRQIGINREWTRLRQAYGAAGYELLRRFGKVDNLSIRHLSLPLRLCGFA